MKTLLTIFIAIFILAFAYCPAQAGVLDNAWGSFSTGALIPVGDFADGAETSIAGELGGAIGLTNKVFVTSHVSFSLINMINSSDKYAESWTSVLGLELEVFESKAYNRTNAYLSAGAGITRISHAGIRDNDMVTAFGVGINQRNLFLESNLLTIYDEEDTYHSLVLKFGLKFRGF